MGSAQSTLGPEIITAGVIVAGSAAAAYGYFEHTKKAGKDTGEAQPATATEKKKKKSKSAKSDAEFDRIVAAAAAENNKQRAAATTSQASAVVTAFPDVVPGSFDAADTSDAAITAPKEKKTKKKKAKKASTVAPTTGTVSSATSPESSTIRLSAETSTPADPPQRISPGASKKDKKKRAASSTPVPAAGPSSQADDSAWTRVESRKRGNSKKSLEQSEILTSDTNLTTSETNNTETSSVMTDKTEDELSAAPERKTFVEKMLPKPRKTGVEECVHGRQFLSIILIKCLAWRRNHFTLVFHASCVLLLVQMKSQHKDSRGRITRM